MDTTDQHAYLLALHRAPGVGAVRQQALIEHFGSAMAVFEAGPRRWQTAGISHPLQQYLRNPQWHEVERDLRWLQAPGHHLLCPDNPAYPPLLREIHDRPGVLFVQGEPRLLSHPALAMVGSRNPSHAGQALARDFAAALSNHGLCITSGLATGIDAAAHHGALKSGGLTIAVTGTGLDRVYPARHRDLARRIADEGVLVSEYPPGTAPLAGNFPRRNRIISGLSVGTLVVEAALRSGSLITARAAMEQGREVFAIPGSIHNPLTRGCHALLRDGAKLVEQVEHVLEELQSLAGFALTAPASCSTRQVKSNSLTKKNKNDDEQKRLLDCMGFDDVTVDQLVTRSGLTPEEVSSMLLLLELGGEISQGAGGCYRRGTGNNDGNPARD